ncbi:MAG: hypothetical protein C4562_04555 [Actinobacteria bacterium]|nr:MAG: hypothetical protein C4562_04555 [Actinomycetota bacterium]
MKKQINKIVIYLVCIIIGSFVMVPVQAKVSYITKSWLKRYYYSKKQSNSRYYTKTAIKSNYYNKASINTLLASYLKTTDAANSYLTQANASNTYLTQANASSTYLTQSNASSTYYLKSGGTVSGSVTATDFNYSSAESKVMTIPAVAFQPADNNIVLGYDNTSGFGAYKVSGTNNYAFAPVCLPDGASITNITMYYNDADGSNNLRSYLVINNITNGAWLTNTNYLDSTGSGGSGSDEDTNPNVTIDNSNRYYLMFLTFNSGTGTTLALRSVKITYTVSSL